MASPQRTPLAVEHRRYPRLHQPVEGTWDGGSGRSHVRIHNLSLGGCFVDGPGTPAIGERVLVELRFEGLTTFTVSGDVVRLGRPQGFAVCFEDVALRERILLAQGLQNHGVAQPYGDSRKAPEGGEWAKIMD